MTSWRIRFEPLLTPAFRAWWRLRRPMTLGVRGIARDEAGRVLLVRHTYSKGWHFPGGGVEHGETAAQALAREMAEEAGVAITAAPVLLGFYANHANFRNDHVLLYRVDAWTPCAPRDNGEIAERGFFPLNTLPEGVTRGTRRRIAETCESSPVSAEW